MAVGSSTHFLRVYFNFGYYLSLVPFRFHRSKANGQQIIKNSSNLKKVVCFFVHALIFTGYAVTSFREFQNRIQQDLEFYFFVLWRLFSILYMLAYFETVWRHSVRFLSILAQLDSEEEVFVHELPHYGQVVGGLSRKHFNFKLTTRILGTCICTLYSVPPIVIVFSAQLFTTNPTWDPYTNIYLYATKAKDMFFFQHVPDDQYEHLPDKMKIEDYAAGLLYGLYQFFNYLRDYYSDLLLLSCVLTMRNLSRKFYTFLQSNTQANPVEICRRYELVRQITLQINSIMRISFGLLLLQAPSVFMSTVSQNHQTLISFLYGILFTTNFFVILVLAAGIVDDMRHIKEWLRSGKNSSKLRTPELLMILEEVEHSPFGVKGIGLPVITFGFVRIVIIVMVAYGIVMVQLQSHEECKCVCQYNPTKNNISTAIML